MINKADVWQSNDKWELKKDDSTYYIMNVSENKVLCTENGQVNMEAIGINDERQIWEKGEANDEGFFTLTNPDTEKVLTATYLNGLSIEGMLFLMNIIWCFEICSHLQLLFNFPVFRSRGKGIMVSF